jgi:hypothetical protein
VERMGPVCTPRSAHRGDRFRPGCAAGMPKRGMPKSRSPRAEVRDGGACVSRGAGRPRDRIRDSGPAHPW